MLLWSQLGPKSEWSDLRATATIEKSFTHTGGDVAQQEARAAQTIEACSRTTKLNQTKSTLFCHSMRDAKLCLTTTKRTYVILSQNAWGETCIRSFAWRPFPESSTPPSSPRRFSRQMWRGKGPGDKVGSKEDWRLISHIRIPGIGLEPACNWGKCRESFQMQMTFFSFQWNSPAWATIAS